jgi:hypothetical protein
VASRYGQLRQQASDGHHDLVGDLLDHLDSDTDGAQPHPLARLRACALEEGLWRVEGTWIIRAG